MSTLVCIGQLKRGVLGLPLTLGKTGIVYLSLSWICLPEFGANWLNKLQQ